MSREPALKVEANEYGNHYITTPDGVQYNLRLAESGGITITADGPMALEPTASNMVTLRRK